MFKQLFMSLLATSLLVVWVAPEAAALVRRSRYSVENFHECNEFLNGSVTPDYCYGGELVTDTLYGWDGTNALCKMTGRVFCIPQDNGYICSDSDSEPVLSTASFSDTATFDAETAADLTVLDQQAGQAVCDFEYQPVVTTFAKFWPNVFLAHSFYEGIFTNIDPDNPPLTYELFELCTIQTDDPQYDCYTLWDSSPEFANDSRPKLPCCGEENTLTVQIAGGGGTVTSDDDRIDCPDGCLAEYDGTSEPYDGCPEVVLKATPSEVDGSGYAFTGWTGGGCDSAVGDTCTTSAKGDPTVTATFEVSYHTLTVKVNYGGGKGKAYIWSPRSNFDEPLNQYYCDAECYKKFGDTHEFPIGQFVVIKRQGAPFLSWGGVCEGTPNSSDTCSFDMTESRIVEVNFVP